jgi:hypothetical protein
MEALRCRPVSRFHLAAAVAGLKQLLAILIESRLRSNRAAVRGDEGHAWCDSLERHLNDDAGAYRRPHL